MPSGYAIIEPDSVDAEQFTTCETKVRKLTAPLGCTELRVNQVLIEPGEVTTPRPRWPGGGLRRSDGRSDRHRGNRSRYPSRRNRSGSPGYSSESTERNRRCDPPVARIRCPAGWHGRGLRLVRSPGFGRVNRDPVNAHVTDGGECAPVTVRPGRPGPPQ